MKFITTPKEQFTQIEDWPYQERFVQFNGMQMHYVEEGQGEIILCLHGEPSWSYLYRNFIKILSPNYRVIAPDLFGFGKSDKPTDRNDYSFQLHFDSLKHFIESIKIKNITLVCQDWGGMLGLSLVGQFPDLFKRLVIMNTYLPIGKPLPFAFKAWKMFSQFSPILPIGGIMRMGTHQKLSKEVCAAYNAPFPNEKHKVGARVFPALVPADKHNPAIPYHIKAREVLKKWNKPALVMFSDKDPIMSGGEKWFFHNIPTAKKYGLVIIKDAGHFLQEEKPEEICGHIHEFMQKE